MTSHLSLYHHTIYQNPSKIPAVTLELIDELKQFHANGTFPLVEDPLITKKSIILGMFILRPATDSWNEPILSNSEHNIPESFSMYNVKNGWSFNYPTLDGGWLIANKSVVDGYRLGFQYGVADAVIIGSRIVCEEGCDPIQSTDNTVVSSTHRGYLWQPYNPLEWEHIKTLDNQLVTKVALQRQLWQNQGYLSSRTYPAQIICTWSGLKYNNSRDFLEARILHDYHPNGERIETYILTSTNGAIEIRKRSELYNLNDRINDIIIEFSPINEPNEIDLINLPKMLFEKYNMKIINHDGGQVVLRKFLQSNIIPQINLTLGRKISLKEIIKNSNFNNKENILNEFSEKVQNFFTKTIINSSQNNNESNNDNSNHNSNQIEGMIPKDFIPITIISDKYDDVAIITFDTSNALDF